MTPTETITELEKLVRGPQTPASLDRISELADELGAEARERAIQARRPTPVEAAATTAELAKPIKGRWYLDGDDPEYDLHEHLPRVRVWLSTEDRWQSHIYAEYCMDGATPVEAIQRLLCEPRPVTILHALDAFPTVDLPQEGWPFWWHNSAWIKVDGVEVVQRSSCGVVRDSVGYYHQAGGWRRAPAPPGWVRP